MFIQVDIGMCLPGPASLIDSFFDKIIDNQKETDVKAGNDLVLFE